MLALHNVGMGTPDQAREPSKLGWFILRRMAETRLSQSGLATRAKVSPSTISRVLYGDQRITPDVLQRIAVAVDLEPNVLVDMLYAKRPPPSTSNGPIPIAVEVDRMLGDDSPLDDATRDRLHEILDSVLAPYRKKAKPRP